MQARTAAELSDRSSIDQAATLPSRRTVLLCSLLSGAALALPRQSAAVELAHAFPPCTPYAAIRVKSLPEVLRGLSESNSPTPITLTDALLRVAQDFVRCGGREHFSNKHADRIKAEVWAMAKSVSEAISEMESCKGDALTNAETVAAVNSVFFSQEGGFAPLEGEAFHRALNSGSRCFVDIWREKRGICEDLVGAYLAVIDVVSRSGIDIPAAAVRLPHHVMVRIGEGDESIFVEMLDSGAIRDGAYYERTRGMHPPVSSVGRFGEQAVAIAGELQNCAVALRIRRDPENERRYLRLAAKCSPGADYEVAIGAAFASQVGDATGDKCEALVAAALKCFERAVLLDGSDRLAYVSRAGLYRSLSVHPDFAGMPQRRTGFYQSAIRSVDAALALKHRGLYDTLFTHCREVDLQIMKGELYLDRLELEHKTADGTAAIACFLRAERCDPSRTPLFLEYRVYANTKLFEITGEQFYQRRADWAQDRLRALGERQQFARSGNR